MSGLMKERQVRSATTPWQSDNSTYSGRVMSSEKIVTISWFDRLKQSVGGVVAGLALVAAMVVLLFWNEGRAVQTARALAEGAGLVKPVTATSVDPANEGKLVHISGQLKTAGPVSDTEFGISAPGLRLIRKVEMFQWVEKSRTEKKVELGGSETQVTTYSYETEWSEQHRDSSRFHEAANHSNPPMGLERQTFSVANASLGAWTLETPVLDLAGTSRAYPVATESRNAIQQAVGSGIRASVTDGNIHLGSNPARPAVGDYRISYQYVPVETVSVVGRQQGSGITAYRTQGGSSLLIVNNGTVTAQDMFDMAASGNSTLTWMLRFVGIALLIFGFSAILGPLSVAASVLPFLGSILSVGTGIIAGIAGTALGSLTIGTAWLFYRPLVAIAIFAAGALVIGGIVFMGRRRKAAATGVTAAA